MIARTPSEPGPPTVVVGLVSGSWVSLPGVRKPMRGNRSLDTIPDLVVPSAVPRGGIRYRVSTRSWSELPRTASAGRIESGCGLLGAGLRWSHG